MPRSSGKSSARYDIRLLTLWVLLAVLACRTAPIRDVVDAPLRVSSGPIASGPGAMSDVDEAIWRAGRKHGWQTEVVREGELRATLRVRHHVAVVWITHDGQQFSIRYADSENLLHGRGEIHASYNVWVDQLAHAIEQEPILPTATRERE